MRTRIFWSISLAVLVSILILGGCVVALEYQDTSRDVWTALSAKAYYLAKAMEDGGAAYLEKVRGYSGRVTLVDTDGTVLFDDRELASNMENHASRPEIIGAMENGAGRDERVSGTMHERSLYYALRLPDGKVLRVSDTAASVVGETLRFLPWMLVVMALLAAAAGAIATRQTRSIVAPINTIDLDRPLETEAYGELSPLLRRIAALKGELSRQVEELRQKQDEFDTITRNMEEGLLLLSREGIVISLNQSAREILHVQEADPAGRHILMLSRNVALEEAVRSAVEGRRAEEIIELGQKKYQITASPSTSGGEVQGVVLLFLDETDKMLAEEKRREFSANVSHELKTPLTAIYGYAELIHNGMAQPKDVPGFAGCICDEANRLLNLVEDIIKLSRLDERGGSLEKLPVDLYALALDTAASLNTRAREKGIGLLVEGEAATVSGVPSILGEVLYNLVDNAIRYSEKGLVTIRTAAQGEAAVLTVADEGIGIPPEHQDRIFERFYRVDKSHSRSGGGTGLGLAIVKRGVLFHGGSLGLESSPGKGSVFRISIPTI